MAEAGKLTDPKVTLTFCLFLLIVYPFLNSAIQNDVRDIYPFQNTSLSFEQRVEDLVSRLELSELAQQMAKGGGSKEGGPSPAIERLGIEPFQWSTECIHGDSAPGYTTSFPQSIGMAAAFRFSQKKWTCFQVSLANKSKWTSFEVPLANISVDWNMIEAVFLASIAFQPTEMLKCSPTKFQNMSICLCGNLNLAGKTPDPSLIYEVAEAISVEVRAKHNDFVSKKSYVEHSGLACFSPVINIMRHPLWGRNQETYGEDPYLSGVYAAKFASGLRGTHPRFYRAAAICKHFDAHGGPEDLPVSRLSFNAIVPERDLRMTYLPQFKACAQGGALGVMCSYNSLNGVPACANKKLLTDILRTEWGFDGFVVSDAGAIEFIIEWHHYLNNIIDTAAACVKAGLNLELHPGYPQGIFDSLEQVVNDGKLTKEMLVERVKPLFLARMKFGEFDPPETNPYTQLNLSDVMTPEHQALSVKTAVESFVLLKNKGFLPMRDRLKSIAIVGPFADNPDQIMGNYAPNPDPKTVTTPKTGLSPLADTSYVVPGCSDTKCLDYDVEGVMKAVSKADVTFLCVGTGQAVETENFDRPSMKLPGYQPFLIQDVIKKALGPVILLVFSGGPVNIMEAVSADNVVAIIQCFFPNQGTGAALYQMITMKSSFDNPAGRLPFTWYATDEQIPSMTNYSMINGTYRYFNGDPLFPFGYGLSYTTFQYNDLVLTPTRVKAGDNVTVTFNITNTGSLSGSEVYEVYMSWLNATVPTPKYQLVGFNRTPIDKGQTVAISTQINSQQMAVWVDEKGFVIEPGDMVVYAGGQLPNQKVQVSSNILRAVFTIYT